jgi:hypothetical protein
VRDGVEDVVSNPRRPGEAGTKIVHDELHAVAEKKALEDLGFIVIEITTRLCQISSSSRTILTTSLPISSR